ncbi:hypothetical protein ACIQYZ_28830 [Rhodococcus erythropolis]
MVAQFTHAPINLRCAGKGFTQLSLGKKLTDSYFLHEPERDTLLGAKFFVFPGWCRHGWSNFLDSKRAADATRREGYGQSISIRPTQHHLSHNWKPNRVQVEIGTAVAGVSNAAGQTMGLSSATDGPTTRGKHLPKCGEFAELNPDLTSAQRELAVAVRGLVRQIDLPCRGIAVKLEKRAEYGGYLQTAGCLSKSALSALINGRRKREPRHTEPLHGLWELAVSNAKSGETVISWEELTELLAQLAPPKPDASQSDLCPTCGGLDQRYSTVSTASEESAVDVPATASTPLTSVFAPVPRQEGDRRKRQSAELPWPAAADVSKYLTAGALESANGLIRHVGIEASPTETAHAIISCRDLGLLDATATIIRYAGARDRRDVLQIIHSLNQRDRRDDADSLLNRALSMPE